MIKTSVVRSDDDLALLVADINSASWDDANEMSDYDVPSLRAYLERESTLFVVCHHETEDSRTLLGFASASFELKPYGNELWLYVDELDVCADQRRRGVGKVIMRRLFELAKDAGCEELWLGTEADNHAANALYRSLEPDDESEVVGYTYEFDDARPPPSSE